MLLLKWPSSMLLMKSRYLHANRVKIFDEKGVLKIKYLLCVSNLESLVYKGYCNRITAAYEETFCSHNLVG